MPIKADRQYRAMTPLYMAATELNKRLQSEFYVEGYAAKYDPYVLFEDEDGPIYERFEKGAFLGCDMSDIILQYNHQGRVYARQSNGSLLVETDDTGLFMAADLSRTAGARDLHEDIRQGMITKMSWGFMPGRYHFDATTRTIVHTQVKKIFDVSAVSIPANDNTVIAARSFADGEIRRVMEEVQKREAEYTKLQLKLKLMKGV